MGRTGVPKGSHLTAVTIEMVSSEYRGIGAEEFSTLIKKNMPPLPGVDNLKYNTNLDGPGAGAAVDIQMTSEDFEELATASDEMSSILRSYPSLISIENTYSAGKQQIGLSTFARRSNHRIDKQRCCTTIAFVILWCRGVAGTGGKVGASYNGEVAKIRTVG